MQGALQYFSDIDDPRSLRNQKHPLLTLIGTTLLASLSGIDSFSGFADFTEAHYEKLIDYFDFSYGSPSHDTYQRLWDAISPSQFYASFLLFTESLAKLTQTFINLDGKTIRHSGDDKPLHIVSAWCHTNQLVLAQEDVVFNEDGACIRNDNAAENIDILRKWALNALQKCKQKPDQSIKSIMRKNSMSFKHLLDTVKKIFHA